MTLLEIAERFTAAYLTRKPGEHFDQRDPEAAAALLALPKEEQERVYDMAVFAGNVAGWQKREGTVSA